METTSDDDPSSTRAEGCDRVTSDRAMNDGALEEAYERLHGTGPEFGGDERGDNGLTNHAPMTVEVLARRGHADAIPAWLDGYVPRLADMPRATASIGDDDWRAALGRGARLGDWAEYFTRRLAERPWTEVLATWWPRLVPGIAAGATHGVIRVGHAVRALTRGGAGPAGASELAHGLAFWAARARGIPGSTAPSGALAPSEAFAALPHLQVQSGLIVDRLARLAEVPGWSPAQAALRAPAHVGEVPALLEGLVEAATLRYLTHGHGSPVLLVHTATAPNAVLHTLPSLPRELWAPSFAAVWSASAALIATYEPAFTVPPAGLPAAQPTDDPVAQTVQRSTEHGDEHVIKLTDTAVEVYERTRNPDALAAAMRAAELIEPRPTR